MRRIARIAALSAVTGALAIPAGVTAQTVASVAAPSLSPVALADGWHDCDDWHRGGWCQQSWRPPSPGPGFIWIDWQNNWGPPPQPYPNWIWIRCDDGVWRWLPPPPPPPPWGGCGPCGPQGVFFGPPLGAPWEAGGFAISVNVG